MRRRAYTPQRRPPLLADFGLRQRARAIGAFGLWPGLADRWEALQALASASRSEVARGRYPSHRQLERWLKGAEGRSLRRFVADGIYDGEWVSEAVVAGERMSILGGRVARPRQIVEVVAEALAAMREKASWGESARREFRAALRVGELVADRAGFAAGTLADHNLGGEIALPEQPVLQRLGSAVTLDHAALRAHGISRADLADLTQPLTQRLAPAAAAQSVVARPLSSASGELILIAPSQLTSAALDRVCAEAEAAGAGGRFLDQLQSCTEDRVETLLRRLGFEPEGGWRAGSRRFRFDSDKLAYVAVVCGAQPAGVWSAQQDLERVVHEFRCSRSSDDQVTCALAVTVSAAGYVGYDLRDESELAVLTLDELEVVTDAHREEPLLLWNLLSQSRLAALGRRSEIGGLDIVGHADRLYRTSVIIVSLHPAFDPAEELLTRARERSERRAAPDPDVGGRWLTVVRSLDAGADNAFERVAEHGERIELFVSCRGQQGWVRAPAARARGDPASAVAQLAARWLSLIWEQAEFLGLSRPERWRLEVSWDEQQRDQLSGETRVAPDGASVTELIAGPALLATLSRLDNTGDREVARAAVAGWLLACGAGPTAQAAASEAVDRMLPAGGASLLVWPANGERLIPERLPPAPAISDACMYRVRSEIADVVRRQYAPAAYEDDRAREVLNVAVRTAATAIDAELAELAPETVYALVACHERAALDELHRGLAVPVRAVLFGRQAAIDEYLAGASDEARRTLALRFLIEHATARPPRGCGMPGNAAIERLRMLADFLLDGGGLSDAVWKGLTNARVLVPEGGPLAISTSEDLNEAQSAQLRSWSNDAPERHQALTEQLFRLRPVEDDAPTPEQEGERRQPLDDAWERAYGFTHRDMARVCSELVTSAKDHSDGVMALPEKSAIALAAQRSGVSPEVARCAIRALVLGPPGDYDPFLVDYRPWRARRKWSLTSRPIIRWASADGEQLLWSAESLSKSGLYRTRMEQNGRGIDDPAVDEVARQARNARDREFNDQVAQAARTIPGASVRARVTKVGGRRVLVNRQDIGDVDVLVVLREAGCVLALETKNFLPSLGAYAIANERERLVGPGGTIELHSRRLAWLIGNPEGISRDFGTPPDGCWRVHGAIVVPTAVTTAFLPGVTMPILAASQVVPWARDKIGEVGVPKHGIGTA